MHSHCQSAGHAHSPGAGEGENPAVPMPSLGVDSSAGGAASIIENRTFNEISVGESAHAMRTFTPRTIELFVIVSGDVNPAHLDVAFSQTAPFHEVIAQGMMVRSSISAAFREAT